MSVDVPDHVRQRREAARRVILSQVDDADIGLVAAEICQPVAIPCGILGELAAATRRQEQDCIAVPGVRVGVEIELRCQHVDGLPAPILQVEKMKKTTRSYPARDVPAQCGGAASQRHAGPGRSGEGPGAAAMVVDPVAEPRIGAGEETGLARVVAASPLEDHLMCEDPGRAAIREAEPEAAIGPADAQPGSQARVAQRLARQDQPATGSSNRSEASRCSRASRDDRRLPISAVSLWCASLAAIA